MLRGVDVGERIALVNMGSLLSLICSLALALSMIVSLEVGLLFSLSRSKRGTLSSDGVIGDGDAEARRAVSGC